MSPSAPARTFMRIALLLAVAALPALCQETPLYKDAARPVDERVRDLLSRMTLEDQESASLEVVGKQVTSRGGHEQ